MPRIWPTSAGSTPALPAYAQGWTDYLFGPTTGSQTVPAGDTQNGEHLNATTTDAAVMSWQTSVFTDDTIVLHKVGTYILFLMVLWDDVNDVTDSIIYSSSETDLPHSDFDTRSVPANGIFDAVGPTNKQDYTLAHVVTPPASYQTLHENGDSADHTVLKQWFAVIYLPTG